ncbi:hypothetical protein V1291_003600 [Nitrobacteraceae bacterium AZCC 1564]
MKLTEFLKQVREIYPAARFELHPFDDGDFTVAVLFPTYSITDRIVTSAVGW